jgi:Tol biopolymer transport system component
LVRVPAEGGPALVVFPEAHAVENGGPRWLAMPALSPSSDRIAFVEMARVAAQLPNASPIPCTHPEPVLDSVIVRVRGTRSATSPRSDLALGVHVQGRDPRYAQGLQGPFDMHVFPFQRLYSEERVLLFRPSWSPDGSRLVFSDGLRLFLWSPGSAGATMIPNTMDGVSPAWSPDGQNIAYTQLQRGDSTIQTCAVSEGPKGVITHIRTGYDPAARRLVLIKPDGSGRVELGEGEDPAWSQDSRTLFFRRDDRIFRSSVDGSGAVAVAETQGGRTPAISPSGRHLAFMRRKGMSGDYDVWLVRLQ